MPFHLECLSPPLAGKSLPITATRPATIKTAKGDTDVGEVVVEWSGNGPRLVNRSRLICTVNEEAVSTAVLKAEDRIVIGKQRFLVVEDAEMVTCSVCDEVFDAVDRAKGWTEGDRRICKRCLGNGVRPNNLASADPVEPDLDEAASSQDGAERGGSAESDRHRHQRRLSASRLAQVDQAPAKPQGLLSKVGQVFTNREERRRLETLELERRGLLEQAGRLALSENNGFGIPDHLYNPLIKGVAVSLRLQDFSINAIERWRDIRYRLTRLDAEVGALRVTLGLGADPGVTTSRQSGPLRADRKAEEERTFALMDGVSTMDLAGAADESTADVAGPPSSSSVGSSSSSTRTGAANPGRTSGRRNRRKH